MARRYFLHKINEMPIAYTMLAMRFSSGGFVRDFLVVSEIIDTSRRGNWKQKFCHAFLVCESFTFYSMNNLKSYCYSVSTESNQASGFI